MGPKSLFSALNELAFGHTCRSHIQILSTSKKRVDKILCPAALFYFTAAKNNETLANQHACVGRYSNSRVVLCFNSISTSAPSQTKRSKHADGQRPCGKRPLSKGAFAVGALAMASQTEPASSWSIYPCTSLLSLQRTQKRDQKLTTQINFFPKTPLRRPSPSPSPPRPPLGLVPRLPAPLPAPRTPPATREATRPPSARSGEGEQSKK